MAGGRGKSRLDEEKLLIGTNLHQKGRGHHAGSAKPDLRLRKVGRSFKKADVTEQLTGTLKFRPSPAVQADAFV